MTMTTRQLKNYGMRQNISKREVYSNTIVPQETRKTPNRQSNFTPKTTGRRRTTTTKKTQKISKRKERSEQKEATRNKRKNSKD